MNDLVRVVSKLVAPLARKVRIMVGRCIIDAVDDSKKMQAVKVQVLEGMVRDDVEHFQPGGLSHVAPRGAEGIFLAVGGSSDHGILIMASERTKRPTGLQPGETMLYAVDGGHLHLKSDGSASFVPAGSGIINVGAEAAAEFAAQAGKTDSRISALESAHNALVSAFNTFLTTYSAHTHVEGAPYVTASPPALPGNTQPPSTPGVPATALTPGSSVAAQKVKVE